jgi:predicted phosphodiesterase
MLAPIGRVNPRSARPVSSAGQALAGGRSSRCERSTERPRVKVGIVSDLHCNHDGLRRALDIICDADELICLGDSICDFRFSNEVVAALRQRGAQVILGNHEEGFLGPLGARARAATWIDRSLLGWLADRRRSLTLKVGGKKLLAVHSTPWEPRGAYVYPHSEELSRFAKTDADFVLYGHTHQQWSAASDGCW